MKIIKLDIYKIDDLKKDGTPKKRAESGIGSMTQYLGNEDKSEEINREYFVRYGYSNINTGYINSRVFMEKDGNEYIATMSYRLDNWDNSIPLGFKL